MWHLAKAEQLIDRAEQVGLRIDALEAAQLLRRSVRPCH
jgi:hypothetical protein